MKNSKRIKFPRVLELDRFCLKEDSREGDELKIYELYGVVVHSGGMAGGHFTAYVKKGSWLHISDSRVKPVTEA